jgi:hypothetical protein
VRRDRLDGGGEPSSTKEVQRADPRLRMLVILAFLSTVVVGAGAIVALSHWLDTLRHRPASQSNRILAAALAWSTGTAGVFLLALAGHVWRFGARARAASQFPPPGTRVIWDTVVHRGPAADLRGKLLQWLAVALGLSALGLVAAVSRLLWAT